MSLTTKQIDSVHYAQNVISLCLEKQYDVIFLGYDFGEKEKNGQQILEELRLSEVISRHCVVIIITAEISQAMVLAALEHKPDSYLCKPYSIKTLQSRLNKCMMKKQAMFPIYQALENNDNNLTVELVNHALANSTPYKIECLGIMSRQYFELNQFELAEEIYTTYQNVPNCEWANIGLGKIALRNNDLISAETIFKDMIASQPLFLPAYDWLAQTYIKKYNNVIAEEILEQAIILSPRSVGRLKNYAELCFENDHFEKAADAYLNVYELANNSIHHSPDNTILFVKSLARFSSTLPLLDAKKMNNRAFTMLAEMNRNFNQNSLRIKSYLLTANLLENVRDYVPAKVKLKQGVELLDKERQNMDTNALSDIALLLGQLRLESKASQLLITVNQQKENKTDLCNKKIGTLSGKQLNENYTIKAQHALNIGKELYENKEYNRAVYSLKEALLLFPNHNGIKLNLLQALLTAYENDKFMLDEFKQAKKIILELIPMSKDYDINVRLKKMKKKYQLLAGI